MGVGTPEPGTLVTQSAYGDPRARPRVGKGGTETQVAVGRGKGGGIRVLGYQGVTHLSTSSSSAAASHFFTNTINTQKEISRPIAVK